MQSVTTVIKGQLNPAQRIAFDMLTTIDPKGLQRAIKAHVRIGQHKDWFSSARGTVQTAVVTPAFKAYLRERF